MNAVRLSEERRMQVLEAVQSGPTRIQQAVRKRPIRSTICVLASNLTRIMNIVGIKPLIAAMGARLTSRALATVGQILGISASRKTWFCCRTSGLLNEGRMIHCGR